MFGNAFLAKPSGDHLGDNLPLVAEMSPWPINFFLHSIFHFFDWSVIVDIAYTKTTQVPVQCR